MRGLLLGASLMSLRRYHSRRKVSPLDHSQRNRGVLYKNTSCRCFGTATAPFTPSRRQTQNKLVSRLRLTFGYENVVRVYDVRVPMKNSKQAIRSRRLILFECTHVLAPCWEDSPTVAPKDNLLHSHRLGQVTREINVETLGDCKPVGNQLEWDDVEQTLQSVDGLGDLDPLRLLRRELRVTGVADDNWSTPTSDDCNHN